MAKSLGAEAPARVLATLRSRLTIFPQSPQRVSARGAVGAAVIVALATVATLARLSGVSPLRTLYAEDGKIFLGQEVAKSGLTTWATAYNGYIHVVARAVAAVAAAFGLDAAPAIFAISSAVILSLLALLVFWASAGYIRSTPVRVLLAVSLIALPVGQTEVYDNAANLHWYVIFATFWVLLWNPERNWELILGSVVAVVAGLSDPLAVLLVPLALLRVVSLGRGGRRQLPTAALAAGLGAQFLAMALTQSERPFAEYANPLKLPVWFLFHIGGGSLLGTEILGRQTPPSLVVAAAATLAIAGVIWFGVRPLSTRRAQAALLAVVSSGAFYFTSVFLTGVTAPRYEALPVLLLYSALALGIDGVLDHVRTAPVRVLATAVVVVVVAVWFIGFRFSAPRGDGPTWNEGLTRAAKRCEATGARTVRVEITPRDGSWWVLLPCRRVVEAADQ